ANTAMFSVFDAVVLHPLPYRDPGRLVLVWQKQPNGKENTVAGADYLEWRRQTKSFARLLGIARCALRLSHGETSISVTREIVGVAGDIRYLMQPADDSLQLYLPFGQAT